MIIVHIISKRAHFSFLFGFIINSDYDYNKMNFKNVPI